MTASGVLTAADRVILALYCEAWDRYLRAVDMVKKTGDIIKSPDGGLYQNPYLSVLNRASEQIAKYGSLLGLDPSSRSRISVDPARKVKSGIRTRPKFTDRVDG